VTQRYVVLSRQPIYGVRTGGIVYLPEEEGDRKTRSGHVEPAPVPKPEPEPDPKPRRPRRTAKPPDPPQAPEPRPDAGLSHVPDPAGMAEESKE
jgi:hypothetical protein